MTRDHAWRVDRSIDRSIDCALDRVSDGCESWIATDGKMSITMG